MGVFSRSFVTVGTTKRLVLKVPEALIVFRGAFFEEEVFPFFTNCEMNKAEGKKPSS